MEHTRGLFDVLPIEVVGVIAEYFDGVTLCKFATVCSQAKLLSESDALWMALLRKEFAIDLSGNEPRERYLKLRKEKWEQRQKLKGRKQKVSAILAAAPSARGSSLWSRFKRTVGISTKGDKEYRVILCGLDAAGKTTALYKMRMMLEPFIPTIGFSVETGILKNWNMVAWDVGGGDRIMALWRHYFQNCVALIFIVDSNDTERLPYAREQLDKILLDQQFLSPYLLVYANKQDLPYALSSNEVAKAMELDSLPPEITWYVQACCATTGDGLFEGLDWLEDVLIKHETTP